jgi:hypothetical protein
MRNSEKINLIDEKTEGVLTTEDLILREYAPRTPEQFKLDLLANIVILEPVTAESSYLDVG